jgi:Protein of unknown function (DUF3592)
MHLNILSALDLPSILSGIRSRSEIVFIVVFLLIWLIVQTGREKLRKYRSRNWPTTVGTISNLSVHKVDGGLNGVDYWKITIDFTYSVSVSVPNEPTGNSYSGSYSFNCTSEEMAQGAMAGLKDKTVSVHYNPKEAAKGILWEDDVWDIWWETYWQLSHPDEAPTENQA